MLCKDVSQILAAKWGTSKLCLPSSDHLKRYLLCKDLHANPCHEMLVGELGSPLSKHFKVKML